MFEAALIPNNAAIRTDAKVLQDIHLKTKNIVVYQRQIEPLKAVLEQIAEQSIEYRASGSAEDITTSLKAYFAKELPEHNILLDDVLNLFKLFEQVTKASSFRILLATVSTNMCRRFHTDINDLRMLCTYIGPGTQWLPNEVVNHKAYGNEGKNQDIVTDESLIQQVSSGDVVILKGALYPGKNAVLHRSPPIEETGEKRLLLRIDTNESSNLWT